MFEYNLMFVLTGSHRKEQSSHFSRALYGRLLCADLNEKLPPYYYLNCCNIFTTTGSFGNEDIYSSKSSQYSINWCDGDKNIEAVDGTTGCLVGRYVPLTV